MHFKELNSIFPLTKSLIIKLPCPEVLSKVLDYSGHFFLPKSTSILRSDFAQWNCWRKFKVHQEVWASQCDFQVCLLKPHYDILFHWSVLWSKTLVCHQGSQSNTKGLFSHFSMRPRHQSLWSFGNPGTMIVIFPWYFSTDQMQRAAVFSPNKTEISS